jgi:hypothetical protein
VSDKLRFGEILVRAGVLEREVLESAIEQIPPETDLGELLIAHGHLDERVLLQTIGKALNLPSVRLSDVQPDQRALDLVPREDCVQHFLLPIHVEQGRTGAHLHVAMANPADVRAIKKVTRKARLRIRPLVGLASEIRAGIAKHYGGDPVPGLMDSMQPEVMPAPEVSVAPEPQEPEMFDFGVTDLGHLEPASDISLPPPIASAPGTHSPLPIGDDLLDALDEAAVMAITSGSAFDRAKVAAVRRTGPPREVRISSPPPGPVPPRLGAPTSPLPPMGAPTARASVTGPLPYSNSPAPLVRSTTNALPLVRSTTNSLPVAPQRVPTDPFGPARRTSAPPAVAPTPLPLGTVPNEARSLDIGRILDRYSEAVDDNEGEGDDVIADALDRYGRGREVRGEAVFAALDRALVRTRSMSGRLTVVLIRQLARRGLVDAEELLADLKNVANSGPRAPR